MESELSQQIAAVRAASELGCFGAHQVAGGAWMPCSSTKQFLALTIGEEVKSRMSLDEMRNWSSIRKAKGKKRKKRWEKLRERRILGIDSLEGGGLVSGNSRTSANVVSGGSIPPMTYGNVTPPNMSTKTIQPAFMPRDNDPDVFVDIESARKRAQQLGCIGVSRRMSKGGKTVWMPCTNLTDYNNLTGMTALGRLNQAKRNDRIVRTVIKDELKRRKKSIAEDILGKALGPKLRGVGRAITDRFDPNAIDGDDDGLLQDSTPFERPNVPGVNAPQKTRVSTEKEVAPKDIESIKNWISSLSPKDREDFRSEPIEAFDPIPGLASRRSSSGTTAIGYNRGPRRMTKPSKPVSVDGLNNPEASPTNPLRNLGGRAIGQIIRGLVDPKNRGKANRKTYILGGNTGSGKSTVLDSHLIPQGLVPSETEAAIIDPDFVKKALPGYDDGAGAGRVHGQSQTVTDKIIRDSANDGLDMVISGSGASRQLTHIRQAKERGESVIGHWVHVPQRVASQRIKKRTEESGRYIPDNTAHMAASIPKTISSAFEEDLLDEFYLWDNDIPAGSPPKLIAKKVKGSKFEIYDQAKFEEFAGDKKWADRWVKAAERNDSKSSGLASVSKNSIIGNLSPQSGPLSQNQAFVAEAKKEFDGVIKALKDFLMGDGQGGTLPLWRISMKKFQIAKKSLQEGSYRQRYAELNRNVTRSDFQIDSNLRIPEDIDKIVKFYTPEKKANETQLEFARRLIKSHPSIMHGMANDPTMYPLTIDSKTFNSPEESLEDILDSIDIDYARVKSLRKALKEELLNNKAFAELVKEFGIPVYLPVKNEPDGDPMTNTNGYHMSAFGIVGIKSRILKDYTQNPNLEIRVSGNKKITMGGLLRHEYGHHLDAVSVATDPKNSSAVMSITKDALDDLFENTENRILKVLKVEDLEELIDDFEDMINNLPAVEQQIFAQYTLAQKARVLAATYIRPNIQSRLSDLLYAGVFGPLSDRGKNLTPYAAWSAAEFFAESIMSITAKQIEKAMNNSGFGKINQDIVDFLTEYFPGISESFWRTIAKINGIDIK